MGYSAYGSGCLELKRGVNIRDIGNSISEKWLKDNLYDLDIYFSTKIGNCAVMLSPWEDDTNMSMYNMTYPRPTVCVSISDYDDHWDEELRIELYRKLAPFVENGRIEYNGDEECLWCYKFKNGTFEEMPGIIVYQTKDKIDKNHLALAGVEL